MGAEIFFRYSLLASLIAGIIIERTQSIVNAFWCLLLSNWPDGTVQPGRGCTVPAGAPPCGDCGKGIRFPPGQARTQGARLTDFCGAAAPQHRRGAPVSRVWGRHSPTSSRPGEQMSGAKFGPRVDTCFRAAPNQFSHFYRCSTKSSKVGFHATLYLASPG